MALTDYDKKNLSKSDQQKVQAATDKWNVANAKGDKAGMAAAAAEAAAVRNNAGYKTDSYGNYSGSYSPNGGSSGGSGGSSGSSNSTNSQYTAIGTYNDANISAWAKNQINYYKEQYNNAIAKGDTKAAEEAHLAAESIREQYGYSGGEDGSQYIELPDDLFEYDEEKPEYDNKYDPQIEALLNEILNRDDFSYDVANDPLYQQYADMYHREGDRAMKETMAEAAAYAGGMNSYAITAAQQANSYYNSQLNDIIPELAQIAYEKYIKDKESKVQDLGLLQNMDATQYARYRDTMTDWTNDRNFAYGVYQDDLQQSNWEKTFNNNNYWANKEFNYNDYWANKNFNYNDEWKNKEWDDNQSQYDQEQARAEIEWYINNGVTTINPDLIKKAGLDQTAINQMIAKKQAEEAAKTTSSSSNVVYRKVEDESKKKIEDEKKEDEGYKPSDVNKDTSWTKGMTDLGLGLIFSPDLLVDLEEAGAIYEKDGKLMWSNGWNAENYKQKLLSQPFPNLISPLNW